ncbi:reverse transcriptase domain-containing protein [Tanacetum coccineum]|uniref:Reverse transcriptase domain-containing protein n=1 Tax=Tanacetum coccineum TaxID=301880 RepID=A0ABQ5EPN4_9ASTR
MFNERPQCALPSNTVPNPLNQINAITTRSGKAYDGPLIPPPVPTPVLSTLSKKSERDPETSTGKAKKATNVENQEPNPYQPRIPYPERLNVRANDRPSAQLSRFIKLFKQHYLDIGLSNALIEMPKFNKWLSALLKNKERLEEIANTPVNAKCSAIILNKVHKKLGDPDKFLIHSVLQDLVVCNALADSGASINLLPLSIYKQLGFRALKPARMSLKLANRFVTYPTVIAEDVMVRVDIFNFLADFIVVDFESDSRVPIILGRPFLRTAKALVDLYEEKFTLRVRNDEIVFYADNSLKNKNKQYAHSINIIDFSKYEPISGSTTIHSNTFLLSSPPVETNDSSIDKFADELTLLDSFPLDFEDDPVFERITFEPSSTKDFSSAIINEPVLERFCNTHKMDRSEIWVIGGGTS